MTSSDSTSDSSESEKITSKKDKLQSLLSLEKIEHNLYRGSSRFSPAPQVYGGQVMGQALYAAYQCVEEGMRAHSMHCYFLRGGDMKNPIIYEVERTRDGKAFSSRRVIAIQHGRQIFNMSVSFQKQETGFDHQCAAPSSPDPETLLKQADVFKKYSEKLNVPYKPTIYPGWFFDVRLDGPPPMEHPPARDPEFKVWFKLKEEFCDDLSLHQAALAYASDLRLLSIALMPHAVSVNDPIRMATIDHSIWFHRDFDIRQWQMHSMESASASGGRGYCSGRIFSQDGTLVASCTQEGLIRPIETQPLGTHAAQSKSKKK